MSTTPGESTESQAVDGSVVVSVLRRAVDGSTLASRLRDALSGPSVPSVPTTWYMESRTLDGLRRFQQAGSESGLARAVREGSTWVRASFLYRWLTAEPEPDVVVIDLRETITVRPFIAALDRALGTVGLGLPKSSVRRVADRSGSILREAPIRVASALMGVALLASLAATVALGSPSTVAVVAQVVLLGIAVLGFRVDATWAEVRASRPVKLLVAALEPPEPPERRRQVPADETSEDAERSPPGEPQPDPSGAADDDSTDRD